MELISEQEYFVFLIGGGFKVGNSSKAYTGKGLGYFVSGESVLTLEEKTAVVIMSGYS